jgi:hypothetical protein
MFYQRPIGVAFIKNVSLMPLGQQTAAAETASVAWSVREEQSALLGYLTHPAGVSSLRHFRGRATLYPECVGAYFGARAQHTEGGGG